MRRELLLSPHLSYTLHLTISVSLFLQLIFQWNDVYIFGMILFDACPDGINVIRMDQKRHSAGSFAISVTRGRCNTVRKALLIQKLMEHHALCVIVKKEYNSGYVYFFSSILLIQHLHKCSDSCTKLFSIFIGVICFQREYRNIFRLQCFRNCKFFCVVQAAEHQTAVDDAIHLIFVDHTENIVDTSVFGVKHAQFVFM